MTLTNLRYYVLQRVSIVKLFVKFSLNDFTWQTILLDNSDKLINLNPAIYLDSCLKIYGLFTQSR